MKHQDRYKSPNKGKPNARIIRQGTSTSYIRGIGERTYEHELHATKGWRKRRIA